MHIPDGYLSPEVYIPAYIIAVAYIAFAWRKARGLMAPERATAITVLAAGIFVAQMLNWPIPFGTSLHFVGGALSGILFGPWLGSLPLVLVLVVQCFVFHDGGITTLGANILNMAIIDVVVGYLVYRAAVRAAGNTRRARLIGAFLGGWLGITAAGAACALELTLSSTFIYHKYPAQVFAWMTGAHAALGVIEGVITALVVDYLHQRRSPILIAAVREAEAVGG